MAAAFSSGENARPSRGAPSHQRSAGQGQPAVTGSEGARGSRLLQSRLSAISSREQPSLFRLPSATPSPRNVGSTPPRGEGGRGGEGGIGGIGGMLASIMSLGAAAVPASMTVPSPSATSSSDGSGVGGMAEAVGRGARQRNASLPRTPLPSLSSGMLRVGMEDTVSGRSGAAVAPTAGEANAQRDVSGARGSALDNASAVAAEENQAGASASVSMPSGRPIVSAMQKKHVYLEGGSAVYTCAVCRAHLATRDHVVSECFHGHGGRAFLFERCVNVTAGRPEDRMLMTGMHVVADISCTGCGSELGWKYEVAAEKSQKYKEGKFILERCAVTLEGCEGDAWYGRGSDGSNSIIGWGADTAPFADGARW